MKSEKETTPICYRCQWYTQSPGGCVETCQAIRLESWIKQRELNEYTTERMNGNKNNCKLFNKI